MLYFKFHHPKYNVYGGGWRWAVCCQKVGKWDFLHYLVSHFLGRALTIYSFGRKPINIFLHPHSDLLHCAAKIIWFCRLDNFSNFCCESVNEALRLVMKGGRRWKLIKYFFCKPANRIENLPIALKTDCIDRKDSSKEWMDLTDSPGKMSMRNS